MSKRKPHARINLDRDNPGVFWGLIDREFDVDQVSWSAYLIGHLRDGGTLEALPDWEWGSHESDGCISDTPIPVYNCQYYRPCYPRSQSSPIEVSDEVREPTAREIELEELCKKIAAYGHITDPQVAIQTANEFMGLGFDDACRRGLTRDEWIWKRSRWLSGFK